jgi:uncharacterized protein
MPTILDEAVAPGYPQSTHPVDRIEFWRLFPDPALAGIDSDSVLWSEILPGGSHWSWRMRRGQALRFVALESGVNVSFVAYAAHEKLERYNMPDSLKAQYTARYTRGHQLMSDMGRAMASFTEDSVGWHDPLGGLLDNDLMTAKYGEHRYEGFRNGMYRSGKDGLLIEIGKHGLARRDLIVPVNLFSKVITDDEGRFAFAEAHAQAGDFVELRLDMDLIVAISSAPHPLDPRPQYAPGKVGVVAWRRGVAGPDDYCRTFRGENARAMHNTEIFYAE